MVRTNGSMPQAALRSVPARSFIGGWTRHRRISISASSNVGRGWLTWAGADGPTEVTDAVELGRVDRLGRCLSLSRSFFGNNGTAAVVPQALSLPPQS